MQWVPVQQRETITSTPTPTQKQTTRNTSIIHRHNYLSTNYQLQSFRTRTICPDLQFWLNSKFSFASSFEDRLSSVEIGLGLSCLVFPCVVLCRFVVSCLVLSCLVFSCVALCRFVLSLIRLSSLTTPTPTHRTLARQHFFTRNVSNQSITIDSISSTCLLSIVYSTSLTCTSNCTVMVGHSVKESQT